MSIDLLRAAILPADGLRAALTEAAIQGFTCVEIEGDADRPHDHLEALADSGLFVACVRLGEGMVEEDISLRRQKLDHQKRLLADAAILGATLAYLTIPSEPTEAGRAYFQEGCTLLTAFASGRGVRLHVLATALTDPPDGVGLALQNPDTAMIRRAGARLGYVRLLQMPLEALIGYHGLVALPLREGA